MAQMSSQISLPVQSTGDYGTLKWQYSVWQVGVQWLRGLVGDLGKWDTIHISQDSDVKTWEGNIVI